MLTAFRRAPLAGVLLFAATVQVSTFALAEDNEDFASAEDVASAEDDESSLAACECPGWIQYIFHDGMACNWNDLTRVEFGPGYKVCYYVSYEGWHWYEDCRSLQSFN